MGILSWFKKVCLCCALTVTQAEYELATQSQPEDYEQALALLSKDIQKRQTRLSEIRLRERRATLLVSVYALVAWIAYTSLWYTDILPNFTTHRRSSNLERTSKAVPVFVGPIVYVILLAVCLSSFFRYGDAGRLCYRATANCRALATHKLSRMSAEGREPCYLHH